MNGGASQICEKGGPSKCSGNGWCSKKKSVVKLDESNKCPWKLLVSKWKKDDDWTLESNPKIPTKALKEQLERKYQIQISDMKVFRAKAKALETIRGDFEGQYSILRGYLLEFQTRNPNTTVKLQVDNSSNPASDTRIFRRKMDFLGWDGAFMKGPYPGMILTAGK
uniref:Uncharacterized protein n=1 Tax=Lactuca sativa TaxID=4236 RepID=A0A9R1W127_LACSA|nr:hypothetical protein LSAT_V11C400177280 [Lactuca sativa]